MGPLAFHGDHKLSVLSGDLGRIYHSTSPVANMQVNGFQYGSSPDRKSFHRVRIRREYEVIRLAIRTDASQCVGWGSVIDQ